MNPYPRKVRLILLIALCLFSISGCGKNTVAKTAPVKEPVEVGTTTPPVTTKKDSTNKQIPTVKATLVNHQLIWDDLLVGPRDTQASVWDSMNSEAKELVIKMVLGNFSNISDLTTALPFDEKIVDEGEGDGVLTHYLYKAGIEIESRLYGGLPIYLRASTGNYRQYLTSYERIQRVDINLDDLPDIKRAFILGSDLLFLDDSDQVVESLTITPDCVKMTVEDVVGDEKPEIVLGYDTDSSSNTHVIVYEIAHGKIKPYDFSALCKTIQDSQVATLENKNFHIIDTRSNQATTSLLPDKLFLNSNPITATTKCLYRIIHTCVNPKTKKLEIWCSWYFEVSDMCPILLSRFTYTFEPMASDKLQLQNVFSKYSNESPIQTTFDIKNMDIYENDKSIFNTGDAEEIINTAIARSVEDKGLTFYRDYYDEIDDKKYEHSTTIELNHPRYHILNGIHVGMTVNNLRRVLGPEDASESNELTYYGVSNSKWGLMYYYFQIETLKFELDENDKETITKIILYNFYGD